jgi:hypothetical protein
MTRNFRWWPGVLLVVIGLAVAVLLGLPLVALPWPAAQGPAVSEPLPAAMRPPSAAASSLATDTPTPTSTLETPTTTPTSTPTPTLEASTPTPTTTVTPTQVLAYLPVLMYAPTAMPVYGMHLEVFLTDTQTIQYAQAAGMHWMHTRIKWADVEPENTTPEYYHWADYDARLQAAANAGFNNIAILLCNPSWAATLPGGNIDKVPLSEFTEFVAATVTRYKDPPYNVKYWEIYNEPDNTWLKYAQLDWWGNWGHDAAGYVQILQAAYNTIKSIDPQAQVLLGGLAYDWFTDDTPPGPFARSFLADVLALGGDNYFDILSFHYYPLYNWRWDSQGPGLRGKAHELRATMHAHSVVKPLAVTETGWPYEGSQWNLSDPQHVLQPRFVAKPYIEALMMGDMPFVIWFPFRDHDPGYTNGFMDYYGNVRQAYQALLTLTDQLADMSYERLLLPAEGAAADVEGYLFAGVGGQPKLYTVWTLTDTPHPVSIPAQEVQRTDHLGATITLHDGDDGAADGYVRLTIGPDPVFLKVIR